MDVLPSETAASCLASPNVELIFSHWVSDKFVWWKPILKF